MTLENKTKAPRAELRTQLPDHHSLNASVHKGNNIFLIQRIYEQNYFISERKQPLQVLNRRYFDRLAVNACLDCYIFYNGSSIMY